MHRNTVIVLNADGSFHQEVSWKDGLILVIKGVAEPIVYSTKVVRTVSREFVVPKVIRLLTYVRNLMKRKLSFSKNILMLRDNSECQYCGHPVTYHTATIDHVLPRIKGGKTSFTNCVVACRPCNTHKAGKLLKETNMALRKSPRDVTIAEYLNLRSDQLGVSDMIKECIA